MFGHTVADCGASAQDAKDKPAACDPPLFRALSPNGLK